MKKILGSNVDIHLKGDEEIIAGVIFDIDDEFVYVQSGMDVVVTIPKANIKYYVSNALGQSQLDEPQGQIVVAERPCVQIRPPHNTIKVCVDDQWVADIGVAQHVNLAICGEEVLKAIWGDPVVQDALRGKVQRALDYDIGQANIYTVQNNIIEVESEDQNTFEMEMPGSKIANPIDMVSKLKGVGKKCRNQIVRDVKK
jgi:hypothetical protein